MLFGDKLKLNTYTVSIDVFGGSGIWGVSGMIVFIANTGISKIILGKKDITSSYNVFKLEIPFAVIANPNNAADDYFLIEKKKHTQSR